MTGFAAVPKVEHGWPSAPCDRFLEMIARRVDIDGEIRRVTQTRRRTVAQSAVVPYRRSELGLRVLLVTSKVSSRWVVPKGMIESGLTPQDSAAKEAFEEGGVLGVIDGGCLGTYRYVKRRPGNTSFCAVRVFALRVTAVLPDWPERRQRRRLWMGLAEAAARVREPELRRILVGFRARKSGRRQVGGADGRENR